MEGWRAVAQVSAGCPVANFLSLNNHDVLARLGEA